MKYEIIYCDPPWDYGGQSQTGKDGKTSGGAIEHYPTMTLKELKEMKPMINRIANDDCLLFMWTSSPHLDQSIELLKHWGFKYATIGFVWDKQRVNPSHYTMSQVEICLIGKKGKIPRPRGARNVRQFLSVLRTKHSEKPVEVRTRIEQMFPTQNKIELFARQSFEGWDVWGNEVDSDLCDIFSKGGEVD
jgi:N6-adenosine-specific RNA methylase IME4